MCRGLKKKKTFLLLLLYGYVKVISAAGLQGECGEKGKKKKKSCGYRCKVKNFDIAVFLICPLSMRLHSFLSFASLDSSLCRV